MIDRTRRFFDTHNIGPCRLLVACSGGIDSTALLIALAELRGDGFDITAGHVNHHLRGEESDADEAFVRSLCEQHAIHLRVTSGPLDPRRIRDAGLEAAAREVRHERLTAMAAEVGARYVATAHQKNDQAETVLMRLISGTGIAGLRGIHPLREDGWIRPLLEVTREEVEEFLRRRGITARLDRMNLDRRFLRNRVREMLNELGMTAVVNLAAIADQARQLWPAIEKAIDDIERTSARIRSDETRFVRWPADPWMRQALLLRHIRRLGSAREISSGDLRRIAASVESITRMSVTRDLELIRRRGALLLRRKPDPTPAFEVELTAGSSAFIAEIGSTISIQPGRSGSISAQPFQLPEGAEPRFVVRNRRPGDRFQPLGLSHHKKLKDFLIDRKIDAEIRDAIPLLVWNDEIVWVAGVEVSERFKVTSPTGALYEVKLEHASRDDENLDRLRR